MKNFKILLILLTIVFYSCDGLTDDIVNSPNSEYRVSDITAPEYIVFQETDSSLVASIKIDNSDVISQVWYNVITPNASETVINNVAMFDDGNKANYGDEEAGDGIYSGKTYLGKSIPSGKYLLQFYVKDNVNNEDDNIRVVGFHQLEFDNGQNKIAPVISDLVMPDSIKRGVDFIFTIKVTDENTLADISQVYFQFTRPDNTSSGTILMVDNGDINLGDETAGDGIYSFKNSFSDGSSSEAAQLGEWTFVFRAEDKGGLLSNEISQIILVQE
ncbi:MAG: hypothetical protein KJ571_08205 [Bacteroidetes bacterium]|nr:hypothetical protein [Bacteroidota bacterium]